MLELLRCSTVLLMLGMRLQFSSLCGQGLDCRLQAHQLPVMPTWGRRATGARSRAPGRGTRHGRRSR